jgi:hypothetical protein
MLPWCGHGLFYLLLYSNITIIIIIIIVVVIIITIISVVIVITAEMVFGIRIGTLQEEKTGSAFEHKE